MLVALVIIVVAQVGQRRPPSTPGPEGPLVLFLSCCCYGTVILIFTVPTFIGMWKVFEKAGEPGWAALVPVYNLLIEAKISGRPEIHGLLCLIPLAGIVFRILILIDLARAFGKDAGYGVGLALLAPVFFPLLGFSNARFRPVRRRARERRYEDEDDEDDLPPRRGRADDERGRYRRGRDADDDY